MIGDRGSVGVLVQLRVQFVQRADLIRDDFARQSSLLFQLGSVMEHFISIFILDVAVMVNKSGFGLRAQLLRRLCFLSNNERCFFFCLNLAFLVRVALESWNGLRRVVLQSQLASGLLLNRTLKI